MTVRLPIPNTPAHLLKIAERLDRYWTAVIADGGIKPTLAEEYALLVRGEKGTGSR